MTTSSNKDPFLVSLTLARALASHERLQKFKRIGAPDIIVDKEMEMRERYFDKLVALFPREVSFDDIEVVTMDSVLRALRNEVLLDLCRTPRGKQRVGAAVSVALRRRWSDEDAEDLPPEFFDEEFEDLSTQSSERDS